MFEVMTAAIDPFTALMIFSAASSAVFGIMGGSQQKKARDREAEITRINAGRQADRILQEEMPEMGGKQTVAYAKANVLMEGSPFIVAQTTARRMAQDATDIRRQGTQQAQYISQLGRIERQNAILQGFGGAISAGVKGVAQINQADALRGMGSFSGGSGVDLPAANILDPFSLS